MQETLKHQFEQIFAKHYERLTNSQQTVSGLPFTLGNIVCFILFGGRELDIEDVYGDVSERYSLETFMTDAKESGVETDDNLQKTMAELVEKKLLHLQPDGHYYSYQATRETARMLNRIYPKMQGMSMLAYIGQTIQEAESGRTDPESALSRFDQTLQKHGVHLPKPKIPVITPPPRPAVAPKKAEETKTNSSKIIRDYVVSTASVKAKIERPATLDDVLSQSVADFMPQDDSQSSTGMTEPVNTISAAIPPVVAAVQEQAPKQTIKEIVDDEAIAAKIAAFEKQLALVCPLCKTNTLKEEETAGGKLFYSCTSDKCNFISWGRPHLIPCARCKNAFMVEVTDNTGQTILKCPRATCQHRQPLTPASPPTGRPTPASPAPAGGVKTMVRKRLVRRKV